MENSEEQDEPSILIRRLPEGSEDNKYHPTIIHKSVPEKHEALLQNDAKREPEIIDVSICLRKGDLRKRLVFVFED